MINNYDYDNRGDFSNAYLGNYRLIRLLGRGGFAAVLLGEHRYLKRLAAIKVLRTVLDDQGKEHFLEEATLLANLVHPHIVRVLEFDIAPRRIPFHDRVVIEHVPFLVMDYVPGGNLRTISFPGKSLTLDKVIIFIKQVAEALYYAHTHHVIHRDIKPENLLLNERQEIMLSDFGLALFAPQTGLLSSQNLAGTLPYTAPEQLRGKPVFASDQYSLGVVAHEWLCGHLPFQGGDAEIIMHHISSPPPRLRSINPSLSQAVEDVVLKALAKEPGQRYPTVLAFAEALERAIRQPRPQNEVELSPVEAPLPPSNVFPFFYYFSQKPIVASPEKIGGGASLYPLATDMKMKSQRAAIPTPSKQRNRQRMLQKVRTFWIEGVLEPSLHEGLFITPELREKQDAVATTPWNASFYRPLKPSPALPPGTSITEVYDQSGGELLILGEAGSGKTTLLLQLARHLLDRAERDVSAPIPVVFPLSSWAEKQLPIDQWLIEELNNKYQVPHLLGGMWLRSESLLPLLDGLDEVTESARSACIVAINTYKQQHGLNPLVVCSRLTDYLLSPPRVLLQRAIVVQSLTMQQVDDYFLKAGEKFNAIAQILRRDALLYGLITTPLMLNIITLTYQYASPADLLTMRSSKDLYRRILDTYVEQMVSRHAVPHSDVSQQLMGGLGHLAQKMQQNNQVVFYLEQMQPKWIDKEKWLRVYMWIAVLLPGVLIGGLTDILANLLLFHPGSLDSIYIDSIYGIVMGYLLSNERAAFLSPERQPHLQSHSEKSLHKGTSLRAMLFVGLITFLFEGLAKGWGAGLVDGIVLGVLSFLVSKFLHKSNYTSSHAPRADHSKTRPSKSRALFDHLKNGTAVGLACGFINLLTLATNHETAKSSFIFLLNLGVRDSLRTILVGILLSFLLAKNDGIIYCVEVVAWSWKNFWKSFSGRTLIYDTLIGMVVGVISGSKQLFQGNISSILSVGFSTGVLITISILLISAILHGISSNQLNDHHRIVPNEGIHRSLFHGMVSFIIGAIITTFFTVITTPLSFVLNNGPTALRNMTKLQASLHISLVTSLLLAPVGGLLVALLLGWLPGWQHGVLRLILRITGVLPFRLSRFLDYATNCLLLRKTGGGYIFIHRTLLEYFASLDDTQAPLRKEAATPLEPLVKLL